jgi:hypothetical protein
MPDVKLSIPEIIIIFCFLLVVDRLYIGLLNPVFRKHKYIFLSGEKSGFSLLVDSIITDCFPCGRETRLTHFLQADNSLISLIPSCILPGKPRLSYYHRIKRQDIKDVSIHKSPGCVKVAINLAGCESGCRVTIESMLLTARAKSEFREFLAYLEPGKSRYDSDLQT